MRNTKVYSITMPPELARQAERLAKREHRTMSELMREALRRYQQPQPGFDVRELIRALAPAPQAFLAMRQNAKSAGSDKLTMAQIDREVAMARKQARSGKKANTTAK
jgi:Arc/MetJ-type ribon-helix-helix transcriptional regulator